MPTYAHTCEHVHTHTQPRSQSSNIKSQEVKKKEERIYPSELCVFKLTSTKPSPQRQTLIMQTPVAGPIVTASTVLQIEPFRQGPQHHRSKASTLLLGPSDLESSGHLPG